MKRLFHHQGQCVMSSGWWLLPFLQSCFQTNRHPESDFGGALNSVVLFSRTLRTCRKPHLQPGLSHYHWVAWIRSSEQHSSYCFPKQLDEEQMAYYSRQMVLQVQTSVNYTLSSARGWNVKVIASGHVEVAAKWLHKLSMTQVIHILTSHHIVHYIKTATVVSQLHWLVC